MPPAGCELIALKWPFIVTIPFVVLVRTKWEGGCCLTGLVLARSMGHCTACHHSPSCGCRWAAGSLSGKLHRGAGSEGIQGELPCKVCCLVPASSLSEKLR